VYDSLHRILSLWSVISNESSPWTKSDTMKQEANKALIDFYKVLATGKEMRKLILILLALVLLATNPDKSNYIDYTKQNILGHNASGLVSILADPLIDRTTTESNLYFATVYRTKFGENNVTTLGVLNKFIPLK